MFFRKKDPVDLRDLPKPKMNLGKEFSQNNGYGFVDLTKKRKLPSEIAKEKVLLKKIGQNSKIEESTSSFNFFNTPSVPETSPINNSEVNDLLRKLSSQISDLDTKLYKMEQRIELLERKAGVGDSSNSGAFNW